jgi:hypothetical protein
MKKYKLLLIALLLCSGLSPASAAETYVYCAQPDGSDWDWLVDSTNNYVKVTGEWGRENISGDSYFNYFSISDATYHAVMTQCPSGTIAQPADSRYSAWSVFKDHYGLYFILGKRTIFRLRIKSRLYRLT